MKILNEKTKLNDLKAVDGEVFFEDMVKCVIDDGEIEFDSIKATNFCKKAIEFLKIIENDPKNKHRKGEFDFCIEELTDYFLGANEYQTTDKMLTSYYDAFL